VNTSGRSSPTYPKRRTYRAYENSLAIRLPDKTLEPNDDEGAAPVPLLGCLPDGVAARASFWAMAASMRRKLWSASMAARLDLKGSKLRP
jgi:hypothetical protein